MRNRYHVYFEFDGKPIEVLAVERNKRDAMRRVILNFGDKFVDNFIIKHVKRSREVKDTRWRKSYQRRWEVYQVKMSPEIMNQRKGVA
ncbi:MAG: hypothetical protein ACUZ8I_10435 [Candidatus Scalindua sp.]